MRQVADLPLWLGHVGDARAANGLHAAGVAAVVDLADGEPPIVHPRPFVALRFPLIDGAGNPPWLLRLAVGSTAAPIRAGVGTLVHCPAGMSRTLAVVAAALGLARGIPPAAALGLVARAGPADISPALWIDIQAAIAAAATPTR